MTGIFEECLSNFLRQWRLEIGKTFIGRLLLGDFFEKLGSTLFVLFHNIFTKNNPDLGHLSDVDIFSRYDFLPQAFILSGDTSTCNRLIDELYLSYLKTNQLPDTMTFNLFTVDLGFFAQNSNIIKNYTSLNYTLEYELESFTLLGRSIQNKNTSTNYSFPILMVKFTQIEYLALITRSNSVDLISHCGIGNCQFILYLLDKYIRKWHEERLPIISVFMNNVGASYSKEREHMHVKNAFLNVEYLFKSWYRYIYQVYIDDPSYIHKEQRIVMFRYLTGTKYRFSEETLDHIVDLLLSGALSSILKLPNENIESLLDYVELMRVEDILNNNSNSFSSLVSSGNFIAIVDGNEITDFFKVFLNYIEAALERVRSINNNPNIYSLLETNTSISDFCGLKRILGCENILYRLKEYTLPSLKIYSDIRNTIPLNLRSSLSGIVVSGYKGCGKSFLIKSISHEIKYDILILYPADIYNSKIGYLEQFLLKIIDFSVDKGELVILFEEIDQYLSNRNSLYLSVTFFIDLISRSNKWCGTKVLVFGTFGQVEREIHIEAVQPYRFFEHLTMPGIGEWNQRSIIEMLNVHAKPTLTGFFSKNSVKFNQTALNNLIKSVSSVFVNRFTPALASGFASSLGMLLVKKSCCRLRDINVEGDTEDLFVTISNEVISIARQYVNI